MTVAWFELLVGSASVALVAWVIVAVAVLLPVVLVVAENEKDWDAPTASVASVHVAVPLEIVQPAGGVLLRLMPPVAAKVRVAELLANGPALLA